MSTSRTRARIDVVGFIGLAIAMVTLLMGLRLASTAGFSAPSTILTLAAAFVVFTLWVVWELRTTHPAVDVRLVVSRRLGPIYLTAFLFGAVMFGTQAPTTTFLSADRAATGYGFTATPSVASGVIAVVTILATAGAAAFAPLARRVGIRTVLLIGALTAAAGQLVQIAFHDQLWQIYGVSAISGFGMGILLGALPALLAERAPSEDTAIATGVYNSLRTLGGAAAGAVFALVLTSFTTSGSSAASIGGYVTIWAICAAAFLVSALALATLRIPREPHAAEPANATSVPTASTQES